MTGGAPTDDPQYELIQKQFECMANYLSWTIVFQKSYSANAKDELANNSGIMEELKELGANL